MTEHFLLGGELLRSGGDVLCWALGRGEEEEEEKQVAHKPGNFIAPLRVTSSQSSSLTVMALPPGCQGFFVSSVIHFHLIPPDLVQMKRLSQNPGVQGAAGNRVGGQTEPEGTVSCLCDVHCSLLRNATLAHDEVCLTGSLSEFKVSVVDLDRSWEEHEAAGRRSGGRGGDEASVRGEEPKRKIK